MSRPHGPWLAIVIAVALFIALAPISVDMYNTICHRAFLDLMLRGNPYALARYAQLEFGGVAWPFDFAYPPLTILFILPGWVVFRLTHSEAAYQVVFKLPFLVSAIVTQLLAVRMAEDSPTPGRAPVSSWYVLLPGVLLLTTIAGGFDAVCAMLILLAVCWYDRGRRMASALALGVAGALRLFPLALVPVYLLHRWREGERKWRDTAVYGVLSIAPLALTCAPFVASDAGSFFSFLGGHQTRFGPFASLNFATALIRRLVGPLGFSPEYQVLGYPFMILTIVALLGAYAWIAIHPSPLARDSLLTLLVFFLVYPKGHGLYITALVPLAIIQPMGVATWVWVPGTVWMLLVNGAFDAAGILYWYAPLTAVWRRVVPESWASVLTVLLSAVQALLILGAISQLVSRARARDTRSGRLRGVHSSQVAGTDINPETACHV